MQPSLSRVRYGDGNPSFREIKRLVAARSRRIITGPQAACR